MAPVRHEQSLERRLVDRRARPTTLWSALRWQGRRTGFRRAGEGHHAYGDCLARRTVVLAFLVFGGSLLDALGTLGHLAHGGAEATPWLALVLTSSPPCFSRSRSASLGRASACWQPINSFRWRSVVCTG